MTTSRLRVFNSRVSTQFAQLGEFILRGSWGRMVWRQLIRCFIITHRSADVNSFQ